VGIGTYVPNASLIVGSGNVGIGSAFPGQALDVTGTVRMTGLTLTGNGAANGYVIVGNSVGVGTWMPVGTLGATSAAGTNQQMQYNNAGSMGGASGLLTNGTNLGIGTFSNTLGLQISGNIGIGTFLAPAGGSNNLETTGNVGIGTYYVGGAGEGALSVMNGNVGIGTWLPSSSLSIQGSIAVHVVATSLASYPASSSDQVILANASGNSVTITLPQAATVPYREYVIKKTDTSTNAVIIQGYNGTENIDGQSTVSTNIQYQSYTIVCDGSQWYII
jgi:hypothetical protein